MLYSLYSIIQTKRENSNIYIRAENKVNYEHVCNVINNSLLFDYKI